MCFAGDQVVTAEDGEDLSYLNKKLDAYNKQAGVLNNRYGKIVVMKSVNIWIFNKLRNSKEEIRRINLGRNVIRTIRDRSSLI